MTEFEQTIMQLLKENEDNPLFNSLLPEYEKLITSAYKDRFLSEEWTTLYDQFLSENPDFLGNRKDGDILKFIFNSLLELEKEKEANVNKFENMFGTTEHLDVRDIINWRTTDNQHFEVMICRTKNARIGLVNLKNGTILPYEFNDLHSLKEYLKNIDATNKQINVLNSDHWVVYVP